MNLLTNLPKPFFVLAPMDDVTDTVFRQVVDSLCSPDLYFTEFTNVEGLQSPGRDNVAIRLRHENENKPIIAQIWGINPENYKLTAQRIVNGEFGAFDGVDINMGCPEKSVVKNGACSALINNRELAKEIIDATKEGLGGKLPLSVKTRVGFSSVDLTWIEFLLKQGLDMLSIHGRTRAQMSKVPANWELIGEASKLRDKISPKTLIVGNGDVMNHEQGIELAEQYKLDGIMIGRGIFSDPYVFSENSPWEELSPPERIAIFKRHIELFENTWHGQRPTKILNKFCKIYINNFDGAKELREKLMNSKDTQELLDILVNCSFR